MNFKQPWMNVANNYLGTTEVSGAANNPEILRWAKIVGSEWQAKDLESVAKEYIADSIPWCGLFAAIVMAQSGIKPVKDPLWARNWAKFGTKLSEPCFGCVLTFSRDTGGHVGLYVSEETSYFHVLGGNQSDTVNIAKVAKSRILSYNWPAGMEKFRVPGRINKKFDGKVSTNEA